MSFRKTVFLAFAVLALLVFTGAGSAAFLGNQGNGHMVLGMPGISATTTCDNSYVSDKGPQCGSLGTTCNGSSSTMIFAAKLADPLGDQRIESTILGKTNTTTPCTLVSLQNTDGGSSVQRVAGTSTCAHGDKASGSDPQLWRAAAGTGKSDQGDAVVDTAVCKDPAKSFGAEF